MIAYIVRRDATADATAFLGRDEDALQAGFVVYPAGGEVVRHRHLPIERRLAGTSEAVLVRRGRCVVDLFDDACDFLVSRELGPGDLVVLLAGGHGFRMIEDTVLFELKQGPYLGVDEKERF